MASPYQFKSLDLPPTGAYAQAYFSASSAWNTTNTGGFVDPTNSGGNALTVRASANLTLTAAASNVCGITFTPASASAVYLIIANTTLYNNSTIAGQTYGRLTDGSVTIAQSTGFEQTSGTSSTLVPSALMGIYAPGTVSPVTVKVQIYGNDGTATKTITAIGPGTSVEWTVIRII